MARKTRVFFLLDFGRAPWYGWIMNSAAKTEANKYAAPTSMEEVVKIDGDYHFWAALFDSYNPRPVREATADLADLTAMADAIQRTGRSQVYIAEYLKTVATALAALKQVVNAQ